MSILMLLVLLLFGSLAQANELYGTVFLVRYEGFSWSPCSFDASGMGTCLSINCGVQGCATPAESIVCTEMDCVKRAIERRGKSHLTGVYRLHIPFSSQEKTISLKQLQVIESFEVIE